MLPATGSTRFQEMCFYSGLSSPNKRKAETEIAKVEKKKLCLESKEHLKCNKIFECYFKNVKNYLLKITPEDLLVLKHALLAFLRENVDPSKINEELRCIYKNIKKIKAYENATTFNLFTNTLSETFQILEEMEEIIKTVFTVPEPYLPFDLIYTILSYNPLCQYHPLAKGATQYNAWLLRSKLTEKFKPLTYFGCSNIDQCMSFLDKHKLEAVNLGSSFIEYSFSEYSEYETSELRFVSGKNLALNLSDDDIKKVCEKFKFINKIKLKNQCIYDKTLISLCELKLRWLSLEKCSTITDNGLHHFSKLCTLTTLDLSSCKEITDAGLQHLKGLPLSTLNLSNCRKITNTGLSSLSRLPLNELNIAKCSEISNEGLQYLCTLQLKTLNIGLCARITIQGLSHLNGVFLTSLNCTNCHRITNTELQLISNFSLTSLDVSFCNRITDAGLKHLINLPLVMLNIKGCPQLTSAGLQHLNNLPLISLNISDCPRLGEDGLQHLENMPLEELALCNLDKLTDLKLKSLSEMTQLKSLKLADCSQISHSGLQNIRTLQLTSLDLQNCHGMDDEATYCVRKLPLTTLNLEGCEKITDAGLQYLHELPLKELNLSACEKITDQGLQYLSDLPLTSLNLSYCEKIALHLHVPSLRKLPLTSLTLLRSGISLEKLVLFLSLWPVKKLKYTQVSFYPFIFETPDLLKKMKDRPFVSAQINELQF